MTDSSTVILPLPPIMCERICGSVANLLEMRSEQTCWGSLMGVWFSADSFLFLFSKGFWWMSSDSTDCPSAAASWEKVVNSKYVIWRFIRVVDIGHCHQLVKMCQDRRRRHVLILLSLDWCKNDASWSGFLQNILKYEVTLSSSCKNDERMDRSYADVTAFQGPVYWDCSNRSAASWQVDYRGRQNRHASTLPALNNTKGILWWLTRTLLRTGL